MHLFTWCVPGNVWFLANIQPDDTALLRNSHVTFVHMGFQCLACMCSHSSRHTIAIFYFSYQCPKLGCSLYMGVAYTRVFKEIDFCELHTHLCWPRSCRLVLDCTALVCKMLARSIVCPPTTARYDTHYTLSCCMCDMRLCAICCPAGCHQVKLRNLYKALRLTLVSCQAWMCNCRVKPSPEIGLIHGSTLARSVFRSA